MRVAATRAAGLTPTGCNGVVSLSGARLRPVHVEIVEEDEARAFAAQASTKFVIVRGQASRHSAPT